MIMPDLRRESFYAREPRPMSDHDRARLWSAESYSEARALLFARELVPALSLLECVEALVHLGVDLNRVEIVPVGIEEAWRGVLVGQFPPPGREVPPDSPVRLFVSHPALADRLPDGFVDRSVRRGEREESSREDWGPEVFGEPREVDRRQEPAALKLLRVLENAIWSARARLAQIESVFTSVGDDTSLAAQLIHWVRCATEGLDADRIRWLGNSLWLLADNTGPDESVCRLLQTLIGLPVRIDYEIAPQAPLSQHDKTLLGTATCRLGVTAVLGTQLDDRVTRAVVVVGPLSTDETADVVRDGNLADRVAAWATALMPVHRPWRYRIETIADREAPNLGIKTPGAILGYTATI